MSTAPALPPPARAASSSPVVRRVLMSADTVGGVWTYAMELCRGLHAAGVQVVLATLGAPLSASQRAEADEIDGLIVEESSYKLEWMEAAEDDVVRSGAWLWELQQRYQAEVVHLNGYAHGSLPWAVPVVMVAHSCVHTWWRAVLRDVPPPAFDPYTRSLRQGLRGADRLVAPTASFLREFEAAHGALPPTQVIANGRTFTEFAPGSKEPFFLSVGRLWDDAKNARALAALAPELPWPVRVVGEATSPDGRRLELANLELLGRCAPGDVARLMSRAAVYVLPARYEPFGLSVLEAAASGCALVLGDQPSLRELWDEAALFVEPDNRAQLRATLLRLAADAELRADLGRRAAMRARRYTADAMVQQYLQLYRQLVARGPRRAVQPTPSHA